MKKILVILILGIFVIGLLSGTILACKENYNPHHKHFQDNHNKWEHHHKWKNYHDKPLPPEPTPISDYCNLGDFGEGNVFGKVFNSSVQGGNVSDFPLNIFCYHGEIVNGFYDIKTNEYGSYSVHFDEELCSVGDIIEISGYKYTYGGINQSVMKEEGSCLNLIITSIV